MTRKLKVVFEHDENPDFSWLDKHATADNPVYRTEADMKAGRPIDPAWYNNPENHVALSMVVYKLDDRDEDWQVLDSLGNIDFLADSDDWATGEFYYVSDLPNGYLQDLAREAGLPK
jgi:hypothetical protein